MQEPLEQSIMEQQASLAQISASKGNKSKILVTILLVILGVIFGCLVYILKIRNERSLLSAPRPSGSYEVEISEIDIINKAPIGTINSPCGFTQINLFGSKVIRTQKEYEEYLMEAEKNGFEVLTTNVNRDNIGVYEKYKHITTQALYDQECRHQYQLPVIDFDQYTLVGMSTGTGGCSGDFKITAVRNDSTKNLEYIVDTSSSGTCEMYISSNNWSLIPKIPNDYTVTFTPLSFGKILPTPIPTPNLSSAKVPDAATAIAIMEGHPAVQEWKKYIDVVYEPVADRRSHRTDSGVLEVKWHASISGTDRDIAGFVVAAWIDPYTGQIEVLDFWGMLEHLSASEKEAIRALNNLPEAYPGE